MKSRSKTIPFGLVFLLAMFASMIASMSPSVGHASIMMALDLPTLVKQADHIAVVDVTSIRAAWDEKHERIYSTIELNVVDTWKTSAVAGAAANPASLTVVQPGGTVGDMSMVIMGMGTFVAGTRSLVFLRGNPAHAQVVGMTQGLHRLTFEAPAKRWTVAPAALSQVKLIKPAPSAPISLGPTSSIAQPELSQVDLTGPVPLDTMKAEVLRLMSAVP